MRLLAKLGKFRANPELPGLSLRLDEPLLQLSNIDGQHLYVLRRNVRTFCGFHAR
jgi:hypothetical protein